MNIEDELLLIQQTHKPTSWAIVLKGNKLLLAKLISKFGDKSLSELFYLGLTNNTNNTCINGNNKKFKGINAGYTGFCSKNCICEKEQISRLSKERWKNINNAIIQEKKKKTNLKRYGVTNILNNKEIKEQYQKLNIKKYGFDNPLKNKNIQRKAKETLLEKYGVQYPLQNKNLYQKLRDTNLERYGVEYPRVHLAKSRIKAENTNLKKYGHINPFGGEEIKNKILNTMMDKYGVENINQRHISTAVLNLSGEDLFILNKSKSLMELSLDLNVSTSWISNRIKSAGFIVVDHNISILENDIKLFISEIYETPIKTRNIIPPHEIDLFIPYLKFGIEVNGSYYHSELNGKDKFYHLNKTLKCNSQNIHLIHIWEHAWNFKKDIYKSIIKNFLGLSKKIYARNCVVTTLDAITTKDFLNENHLQGHKESRINYGLIHNNQLVSIITLSKSRYNKKYDWEIIRFCNQKNTIVIGGIEKLFKKIKLDHSINSVITYSDRSLFTGNVYKKLGFKLQGYSQPNYFYTKDYINFHSRIKFQKHKLPKLLEIFDSNLTEWENMQLNGWDRIWDCGNSVWVL